MARNRGARRHRNRRGRLWQQQLEHHQLEHVERQRELQLEYRCGDDTGGHPG
ncbi:MAG: hypothetical protein ACLQA5_23565 [Solirubrobacteraceae bacterium]